jgi:hypothetical protein
MVSDMMGVSLSEIVTIDQYRKADK